VATYTSVMDLASIISLRDGWNFTRIGALWIPTLRGSWRPCSLR